MAALNHGFPKKHPFLAVPEDRLPPIAPGVLAKALGVHHASPAVLAAVALAKEQARSEGRWCIAPGYSTPSLRAIQSALPDLRQSLNINAWPVSRPL